MIKIPTLAWALCLCFLANIAYAGKPERKYEKTPANFNMKFVRDTVVTQDNVRLIVWDYAPSVVDAASKPVIVMAYGDAGNMSYWIEQAAIFVHAGYRVISFDYRGYGESDDFNINENQLYYNEFVQDLAAVLDYAKNKYSNQKCGLYALSMGTLIGVLTLEKTNVHIDFFIGEGFVLNPQKIADKLADFKGQKVLLPPDVAIYMDKLSNISVKMLVFAGKYDPLTSLDDAKTLVNSSKNRQLIEFKGGHLQGLDVMKEQYLKSIQTFLDKILD